MTTRMRHPDHGWTHAYTAGEVEAHRANGWVEDVPEPVAAPEPAEPNVHALRERLTASGIAFDRRWGLTRLQQALKD